MPELCGDRRWRHPCNPAAVAGSDRVPDHRLCIGGWGPSRSYHFPTAPFFLRSLRKRPFGEISHGKVRKGTLMMRKHFLVVDDDPDLRGLLQVYLESHGYAVE